MCHRRWHELHPRRESRNDIGSPRGSWTDRMSPRPIRAEQRLGDWLAELEPAQSAALDALTRPSQRQTHPARHRRILALSVRPDPRRRRAAGTAARVRPGAAPRGADRTDRRARCGRGRRDRRDAAASPHEGGSRTADRAVRHRRGLAGDAGHRGADRSCDRLGADGAALPAARRRPRAAASSPPIPSSPRRAAA